MNLQELAAVIDALKFEADEVIRTSYAKPGDYKISRKLHKLSELAHSAIERQNRTKKSSERTRWRGAP